MPTLPPHCPVELGSVSERDSPLAQLHQLAIVGGPCWRLARVLKKGVQVDGENSLGQTGLFLSALLGRAGAVRLLLRFGADPNHRCLDGSTPVHAGAFSGHCQVFLWLLEAGGDLRLHDQQGWTAGDWAQQAGAESWQVLELLRECRARMSLLAQGGETALASSLGELWGLRAGSLGNLHLALSSQLLPQAEGSLWPNRIQRSPQVPGLGFGQLSSLRPLGLTSGVPLVDPEELLPAQGEPDRTYECGAHTIMVNLLWRGHPVTVRKLKPAPARALPDLLLSDLKHCSLLHHPNLLLLMALSPSPDLAGLCLLFEPIQEGSLHRVLHSPGDAAGPRLPPGFPPGQLLLQVLEALLFLQGQARAHGGLSSHAVQLVRPGLAKVSNLEHGRSLPRPQPERAVPWGGPRPGPPPPPELYPWLPLELIRGDSPTPTSDLYSFCILTQEVFTGSLPWAGQEGLQVKAKLESGEGPALAPQVPPTYQALVKAGLRVRPRDRKGSLQDARYKLRVALAQESTLREASMGTVGSPSSELKTPPPPPGKEGDHSPCPPHAEQLPELDPKVTSTPRPPSPKMAPNPNPSETLKSPESGGAWGNAWSPPALDSGSSLTLGSSLSLSSQPETASAEKRKPASPEQRPALLTSLRESASLLGQAQGSLERLERRFSARIRALQDLLGDGPEASAAPSTCPQSARSFQECIDLAAQARRLDRQEGRTQVLVPELSKESPFTSLQKLDLLEEIITELQGTPKPRS
ncbi:inactive serine/threonine-protein kinase TEX14-like isoform X1 [Antechinus flavipes]|uniref:inactive serine/threonine-protein kinase TEX14-like isoform X1 n=1 Tax=Antechinus flavipes TaxID=38775 RepID=UPI0022360427|nr:inactive serine/threonine-protein kinase TEX14-like isoform X1 [Antechinus flavipes]